MPTKRQHITKSQIAEDAQSALQADSKKHLDWVVVTTFYCALHWVNAFLASKNYPEHKRNTHKKLENAIGKDVDLHPIRENYKRLYDASKAARYMTRNYNNKPTEVQDLVQIDLVTVVTHIDGLINPTQT